MATTGLLTAVAYAKDKDPEVGDILFLYPHGEYDRMITLPIYSVSLRHRSLPGGAYLLDIMDIV